MHQLHRVLTCTETAVPPGNWLLFGNAQERQLAGAGERTQRGGRRGRAHARLHRAHDGHRAAGHAQRRPRQLRLGQSVTFRLDDASIGTPLAATLTPATIPATGAASASITLPKGVSDGTHTIYAVGDLGDVAPGTVSVNVPAPTPVSVGLVNAGQSGRIEQSDRVEVAYSQQLDVASICSTWSNVLANQTINSDNVVTVTIADDAAASGNDLLRVSTTAAACGGQFRFGDVDLGSSGFVRGNTTFVGAGTGRSLLNWDATNFKLTITLGARGGGPNPGRVNTASTAVYTPDPAMLNPSGRTITGTASVTAIHF